MEWIGQIALILHIAFAAVWFGAGIRLAGQVRAVAALDGAAARPMAEDINQTRRIILWMVGGTLLFSLITFFSYGGFGVYGPRYHASLGLILIMGLIEIALIQPTWRSIRSTFLTDAVDTATPKTGRMAMFVGINHLLWVIVLVLMVWRL